MWGTNVSLPRCGRLLASAGLLLLLTACASHRAAPPPPTADAHPLPATGERDATGAYRFNMTQNGRRMSADEFDAWMKARGIRVAKGAPAKAGAPLAQAHGKAGGKATAKSMPKATPKPGAKPVVPAQAPVVAQATPKAKAKPKTAAKAVTLQQGKTPAAGEG